MKKSSGRVGLVFFLLAAAILVYFVVTDDGKHYQWIESYRADSKQPYGTFYLRKMLESYRPGTEFIFNDRKPLKNLLLEIGEPAQTDYVFVGQNIFLDEEGVIALRHFIEKGGDVFIASLTPPEDIINAVYFRECDADLTIQANQASSAALNFFHDTLKVERGYRYAFRFEAKDYSYGWNHFNDSVFCASAESVVPLGHLEDERVNFIRIPAGNGNVYLHSNPLVFTNYFLTDREKLGYASGVFSHLDGKDIVWDEFSKIPFTGNNNAYNSPLYYILQQPSLKYAWWLMLLTVVLYVLFAAKRRQRVIPVMEPKSNTSLEFVDLISQLHYKNGDHLDMVKKKMRYFLYFVRSKYGIHAEKFREEHIRRLAEKSRVSLGDVQVIFSQFYLIEEKFREDIEVNRLVNLYDAIENFYRHCK